MAMNLYRDDMPKIFYESLEKGLTIRLCAIKLKIGHSTLHEWLDEAAKEGEGSKYWALLKAKEKAMAARAERLMSMFEKASANRAPHHLAKMLTMCDQEYKQLDNDSAQNQQQQQPTNATTLTDAERLAAAAKLLNCNTTR